ncbi:MAG: TlpA disulfide reductase family protein [Myxococcota bacterium]
MNAAAISRRLFLAALAAQACTRREPEPPALASFLSALPREVAGEVPFDPVALHGRVVLITFVATWCFPCLAELAVLGRLERDFGAKGFSNVLVGMDLEGRKVLEPFAQGYQLTWPLVVADDRLRAGDTPFGRIRELPSRILFGRDGKPVLGYSGVGAYEDLAKVVAGEVEKR